MAFFIEAACVLRSLISHHGKIDACSFLFLCVLLVKSVFFFYGLDNLCSLVLILKLISLIANYKLDLCKSL